MILGEEHIRTYKEIMLDESSQREFLRILKREGMIDTETVFQILQLTNSIIYEDREILVQIIDVLLSGDEETKREVLERLQRLLSVDRKRFVQKFKTFDEMQYYIKEFAEGLKNTNQ